MLRRRRHHAVSLEDESPYEQIPDFGPRPEQVTLQHEQSEQVQRLLETLPADYRLAITLRYWHDLSYTEIAETLHTTESAVKSRLHRAREAMAEKVRQEQAQAARKEGEHRPYLRPASAVPALFSAIPII
jgi:RNA polymerase sigma-70 factor (ECF subfamily)